MAQSITPALEAILASKLQVGDDKPRAEIEIDYVIPGYTELGTPQDLNLSVGTVTRDAARHVGATGPGKEWEYPTYANDGSNATSANVLSNMAAFTDYLKSDLGAAFQCTAFNILMGSGDLWITDFQYSTDGSTWLSLTGTETGGRLSGPGGATFTFTAPITARYWAIKAIAGGFHPSITLYRWEVRGTPTVEVADTIGTVTLQVATLSLDRSRKMAAAQLDALLENEDGTRGWYTGDGRSIIPNNPIRAYAWYGAYANRVCIFTGILDRLSEHRNPKTISIKARSRMKWLLGQGFEATGPQGADEEGAIRTEANGVYLGKTIEYIVADILDRGGWPAPPVTIATSAAVDDIIDTTTPHLFVAGDRVRFSGLTGGAGLSAGVGYFVITANLAAQTFQVSATPGGAAVNFTTDITAGTVRLAARDIATTGVTLSEYVLADKGSWVDQITGSDRLTTAANCDFWEDELGVAHFEPSPLVAGTEPATVWDFAAGVNVMALDHEVDDEDRATRVEVGGPMTSAVPIWEQTWSTSKLDHPAGVWYDPADPDYIRVVDRVTKRIYRMKQSDRTIASSKYLGGYPLGLSGDPLDATHYYVLHAPWRNTGSTSGNSVKKYLKADHSLVATYALPDGRWSDMKTDGTNIWLTNYDDGKLYKRSMTGTAVASYTIAYGGVNQTQATGMWLNGTAMGLFFSAYKRFLVVSTSAPTTVTSTQSTKGTRIAGGEIDTDTDIDLYAVAGAGSFGLTSGMVAKFALAELVTNDVTALAVDWDLEDALGFQSGIADRTHTDCPNNASPHPYEIRQATHSMKVVQSLAQAGDVADALLALLSRLRRVLDLGTTGHPGIQINDPISYTDAIAGAPALPWVIDSYRKRIAETYTATMSVLPWEAP